jgi:hypothetical protein
VPVGLKQRGESISLNPVTKLTLKAFAGSIGGRPDAVTSIPIRDCDAPLPVPPVGRTDKYEEFNDPNDEYVESLDIKAEVLVQGAMRRTNGRAYEIVALDGNDTFPYTFTVH